jgi:hypothetical protein
MLQAGRWRVLFVRASLNFLKFHNNSSVILALLRLTQSLKAMNIRKYFWEGKALPARKADYPTAIFEPII